MSGYMMNPSERSVYETDNQANIARLHQLAEDAALNVVYGQPQEAIN